MLRLTFAAALVVAACSGTTPIRPTDGGGLPGDLDGAVADGNGNGNGTTPDAHLPPGAVTLAGVVMDDRTDVPLAGATVMLRGLGQSATTDATGSFSFQVAPGSDAFVTAAAPGFRTTLVGAHVPPGGLFDLEVEPVPDDLAEILGASGRTQDATKGLVILELDNAVGGEQGSISAASDGPLVFTGDDVPMQSNTIPPGGDEEIVFTNVEPGETTVTATCAPLHDVASWPVDANVVTYVERVCF